MPTLLSIPWRHLAAVSVLALAPALPGCGGVREVAKEITRPPARPVVGAVRVRVLQQTEQAARMEISVDLSNPNLDQLPMPAASYILHVDGAGDFTFQQNPNRTIPGEGRQVVILPAVVVLPDVRGRAYRVTGSIAYKPPGEIRKALTDNHVPLPRVRFEQAGNLE